MNNFRLESTGMVYEYIERINKERLPLKTKRLNRVKYATPVDHGLDRYRNRQASRLISVVYMRRCTNWL